MSALYGALSIVFSTLFVLVAILKASRRFRIHQAMSKGIDLYTGKDWRLLLRLYEAEGRAKRQAMIALETFWPVVLLALAEYFSQNPLLITKVLWWFSGLALTVSYILLWSTLKFDWARDYVRGQKHRDWRTKRFKE